MNPSRRLTQVSLAIACPMANESQDAVRFVDAVLSITAGLGDRRFFAVIDRASKDNTRAALETLASVTPALSVIWAPENDGVVDAYRRGYEEALKWTSDWILEIDAGFSHQPSDIPLLLEKMCAGYDCVFGSRFCPGGSMTESSRWRRAISYGGTLAANLLLGTKLTDMTSGFQLFRRESLELVLRRGIRSRGPFFQTEIKTYCRNLKIAEVPIQYRAPTRAVGRSDLADALSNLWRLFRARLLGEL